MKIFNRFYYQKNGAVNFAKKNGTVDCANCAKKTAQSVAPEKRRSQLRQKTVQSIAPRKRRSQLRQKNGAVNLFSEKKNN